VFFFSFTENSPLLEQKEMAMKTPKQKFGKIQKIRPFSRKFFWDSPVLDNQSYVVASM
jgi:hypothetical protein